MATSRRVVFYHSPQSRSAGTLFLLEELGADYELRPLDLQKKESRSSEYLGVNPMGKVPAIVHDGALVTEQGAVYTYLADLYPEAGLTPAIGDPLRGPYLRWMFFYNASFEPALIDKSMKREPAPPSTSPYGDYDTMLKTLLRPARRRSLAARRALHRGRRAVGHRAALDDDVQARPGDAGDQGLHRARHRAPGGAARGEDRRRHPRRRARNVGLSGSTSPALCSFVKQRKLSPFRCRCR